MGESEQAEGDPEIEPELMVERGAVSGGVGWQPTGLTKRDYGAGRRSRCGGAARCRYLVRDGRRGCRAGLPVSEGVDADEVSDGCGDTGIS